MIGLGIAKTDPRELFLIETFSPLVKLKIGRKNEERETDTRDQVWQPIRTLRLPIV